MPFFEVTRIKKGGATGKSLGVVKARSRAHAAKSASLRTGIKRLRVFDVKVTPTKRKQSKRAKNIFIAPKIPKGLTAKMLRRF